MLIISPQESWLSKCTVDTTYRAHLHRPVLTKRTIKTSSNSTDLIYCALNITGIEKMPR